MTSSPERDDERYFAELAARRPSYGRDEHWWAVAYGASATAVAMTLAAVLRRRLRRVGG